MHLGIRSLCLVGSAVSFAVAWYGQYILRWGPERLSGAPLLAVGAVAAVLFGWLASRDRQGESVDSLSAGRELLVLGLLLAVGVWLRTVDFNTNPTGMNHDAAWNGMYANYIRGGGEHTPYTAAAWGRETLFMYVVVPFQTWFGSSAAAVQAASTVMGLLALLPLYLLARELFGVTAGIASLGFFAASGWHWVFSRVGWRCIGVPPFEALALFGLWRALHRGGVAAWLLAGAATALSIYTYNAARIVPLMIGALVIVHLVFDRKRWKAIFGGALAALVSFLTVGGPMLWYAANNWIKFQGRAEHLLGARAGSRSLAANAGSAFAMFNYRAGGNDFFVSEPLLEPIAGVFFLVGALVLVCRVREANARFVVVGFALSLLPGLLSFPNGNRCITAMPFVYVVIGAGCAAAVQSVAFAWRAAGARLVAGALLGLFVVGATVETYGSFVGSRRPNLRGVSASATAAGEYLQGFGGKYRKFAVSSSWPRYTLMYLGFTGGNPLEPDITLGRSLEDVEGQIPRFGRKGLVVVTDTAGVGQKAREGLRKIFPNAREEPVVARRQNGEAVARAVVIDPKPGAGDADAGGAENAFDGGKGTGDGQFDEPMGVAADSEGNLYVSERLNHRVQKFSASGDFLKSWGQVGNKPGEFREPLDLHVEGDRLYVLDTWNTRVQVFDLEGNFLRQIGPYPMLGKPRGIFVLDGEIYLANSGYGNVVVFDEEGRFLRSFPPRGESQMKHVVDLVVDSRGNVYVNNSQFNRVEVFSAAGVRTGAIEIPDWNSPYLKEFYMTIDADDVIYISDWDLRRIRRITSSGEELAPIGPRMMRPSGLVLTKGRLITVARGENVLRVVELAEPDASP